MNVLIESQSTHRITAVIASGDLSGDSQHCEVASRVADDLIKDPAFAAIRGKRKRCVYVQDKYGGRLPKSTHVRRVDANWGHMDTYLVDLVERVSDRLEVLKG